MGMGEVELYKVYLGAGDIYSSIDEKFKTFWAALVGKEDYEKRVKLWETGNS